MARYRLQVRPDNTLRVTGELRTPGGGLEYLFANVKNKEELPEAVQKIAQALDDKRKGRALTQDSVG